MRIAAGIDAGASSGRIRIPCPALFQAGFTGSREQTAEPMSYDAAGVSLER